MARSTEAFKLEQTNYSIRELKASDRNMLLFETSEMLGESSGSLLGSWVDDASIAEAAGLIIGGLYKNANPQRLTSFIKQTIQNSVITPKVDDIGDSYENHFCEHYDHQWAVLQKIYIQNFGKTIDKLKKKLSSLGILAQTSSQSQKTEKSETKPEKSPTRSMNTNNYPTR